MEPPFWGPIHYYRADGLPVSRYLTPATEDSLPVGSGAPALPHPIHKRARATLQFLPLAPVDDALVNQV